MKDIYSLMQELHQELIKTKDELLEMIESNKKLKILRSFNSLEDSPSQLSTKTAAAIASYVYT